MLSRYTLRRAVPFQSDYFLPSARYVPGTMYVLLKVNERENHVRKIENPAISRSANAKNEYRKIKNPTIFGQQMRKMIFEKLEHLDYTPREQFFVSLSPAPF